MKYMKMVCITHTALNTRFAVTLLEIGSSGLQVICCHLLFCNLFVCQSMLDFLQVVLHFFERSVNCYA